MTSHQPAQTSLGRFPWRTVLILVAVVCIGLGMTLFDPGLTIDEPINAQHGKTMVSTLTKLLWPKTLGTPLPESTAGVVVHVWRAGHEHPPLTRFAIGLAQRVFDPHPEIPTYLAPRWGGLASIMAFAVLMILVAHCTHFFMATWYPKTQAAYWAALAALASLVALPRLLGHARLASPEMLTACFYFWAWYQLTRSVHLWELNRAVNPRDCTKAKQAITLVTIWRRFFFAGLLLGLALLCKLTTVLVPLFLLPVLLWTYHWRCLGFLTIWLGTAGILFIGGWPWLWPLDLHAVQADYTAGWLGTWQRCWEFLATGVNRATIYTWYFNQQWPTATATVPWHYCWVYVLVTVPIPLLVVSLFVGLPLTIKNLISRQHERFPSRALVVQVVGILLFFSQPRLHRYDGERLFLFFFPFLAVLAGIGLAWFGEQVTYRYRQKWPKATKSWPTVVRSLLVIFVGCGSGWYAIWQYAPVHLSYYNGLVGGLPGADRLGLELNYWGDCLTPDLLDQFAQQAPVGTRAALIPTLYERHAYLLSSPIMSHKNQQIVPGHLLETADLILPTAEPIQWAIVYRRDAYLIDPLPQRVFREGELCGEWALQGVWLARIYTLPPSFFTSKIPSDLDESG